MTANVHPGSENPLSGWSFLVSFAALAVACSGGCPTLEACDIRDATCQEATAEVAACLRGGDVASVPVTVVDADSFVARRVGESAEVDPIELDVARGLSLLGHDAPPEAREQTLRAYYDTIGAFYSRNERAVTVLDRGYALDSPGAVILLLHEMIHAMQGAEDDDVAYPSTYDGSLTRSAMIEGEAVLYQDIATLDAYGRDRDVAWGGIFRQFKTREWNGAPDDPSLYDFAWRRFPYAFGGDYINRAWRDGGNDRVRDAMASPPLSTLGVLGGYPDAGDSITEAPNDVGMPLLPVEYALVATRRLGAWVFRVWHASLGSNDAPLAFDTNLGFKGDVLTIFRNASTGAIATFWRLRFDSRDQAARLDAVLPSWLDRLVVDRDVLMVYDTVGALTGASLSELAWGPAPDEDSTGAPDDEAVMCTLQARLE